MAQITLFLLAIAILVSPENNAVGRLLEHPLQTAVVAFLAAGNIVLLNLDKYAGQLSNSHDQEQAASEFEKGLPLVESEVKWREGRIEELLPVPLTRSVHWIRILGTALLLSLRVVLFYFVRRIAHTRCKIGEFNGYEYIPFLLLVAQWGFQPHYDSKKNVLRQSWDLFFCGLPLVFIAGTHHLAAFLWSRPSSTYVCGEFRLAWLLQIVGVALDCTILLIARNLFRNRETIRRSLDAAGSTLLTTSLLLIIPTIIWEREHTPWDIEYLTNLLWCSIPAIVAGYGGSLLLVNAEAFDIASLLIFISTCTMLLSSALETKLYSLPTIWPALLPATTTLHIGCFLRAKVRPNWSRCSNRMASQIHLKLQWILAVLGLIVIYLTLFSNNTFNTHPINDLIREATCQHQIWLQEASPSNSLTQADREYRRRYGRSPPPMFDKWYSYAKERQSVVIDEFDSMFQDLLPFWAISPHELRKVTNEITANPSNELAKLQIRNGKMDIGEMPDTHRWMLEGIVSMLENFCEWLPDMDLAFNINDEPRVAVPYEILKGYESMAWKNANRDERWKHIPPVENVWGSGRADLWDERSPIRYDYFIEESIKNSFITYGSISCPPNSPARTEYPVREDKLCMSCVKPHSIGGFVANWTLSGSPCHQPDLKSLHGFYISPASFKATTHLVPIFSQGKPQGFADILYPSPWNYNDKAVYAPTYAYPDLPFSEKQNTLFWRGATSEGLSVNSEQTWRGMLRQRMVNLGANAPSESIPMLLPQPQRLHRFQLQYPTQASVPNTTIDAAIVDEIVRCGQNECADQAAELRIAGPIDFQAHWKYRYLMDMDGAGFSGRFLPFLKSKSLPFKTALIRAWYDGRITAWKHFIPIDLRLHDLWSTLSFFDSDKTAVYSPMGSWVGETKTGREKAEEIALEGKEWAEKVLRKEDMEIYFFRLLLEWGRLTDDRRDEIGFDSEKVGVS